MVCTSGWSQFLRLSYENVTKVVWLGIRFPLCTASMKPRETSASADLLERMSDAVSRAASIPEVEGQPNRGEVTILAKWASYWLDYYKGQRLGRRMECELLAWVRTRLWTLQ